MLQGRVVYVAKAKCIRCRDKIYMLQRQTLNAAKTKCKCCKKKAYMLQGQSTVLDVSAPAGAFFSLPKIDILFLAPPPTIKILENHPEAQACYQTSEFRFWRLPQLAKT